MISLAMIVKNEEQYIDRCLKSASLMVDEIIVVDTGSSDRTKEIAADNGAQVFDFEWCDDFSAARNFAIERTTGDWVLVLDADEYFPDDYSDQLREFTAGRHRIGRLEIVSRFMKDGQTHQATDGIPRLFPRHIRYVGRIHEQLHSNLTIEDTGAKVLHDGYFMTDKSARNIPLMLKSLEEQPNDAYLKFQIGKQYRGAESYELAEHYLKEAYKQSKPTAPYFLEAIIELLEVLTINKQYESALELAGNEIEWLEKSPDFAFSIAQFLLEYAIDAQDFSVIGNIENSYLKCLELGRAGVKEIVIGSSTYLAAYNLAVFYESIGNEAKAKEYYALSDSYGYEPARERLQNLAH